MRLMIFFTIGYGTVVEFMFVICRLMWQVGDLFGKEKK